MPQRTLDARNNLRVDRTRHPDPQAASVLGSTSWPSSPSSVRPVSCGCPAARAPGPPSCPATWQGAPVGGQVVGWRQGKRHRARRLWGRRLGGSGQRNRGGAHGAVGVGTGFGRWRCAEDARQRAGDMDRGEPGEGAGPAWPPRVGAGTGWAGAGPAGAPGPLGRPRRE